VPSSRERHHAWPPGHRPEHDAFVACILTAMSLVAFLGLRHPVTLLPLLLFESAWKILWLAVVALPRAASCDLDAAAHEVVVSCSLVVVILAVTRVTPPEPLGVRG